MKECYIFETDEYTRKEAERVRKNGGGIGSSDADFMVTFLSNGVRIENEEFLVSGAYAEGCVAKLTAELLRMDALTVTIDVRRSRTVGEVAAGREMLSTIERKKKIVNELDESIKSLEGTRLQFIV